MAMSKGAKRSFHQELVLNQWMMGFFKGGTLHALKNRLGEDRHEGIDDNGQTGLFHALHQNLFEVDRISEHDFRRYDLNIVLHWNAITERRNKVEGTVFNIPIVRQRADKSDGPLSIRTIGRSGNSST